MMRSFIQNIKTYSRPIGFLLLALILLLSAYSNSWSVPFIFDDQQSIVENDSIRSLIDSLGLRQEDGETTSFRPLLNLTFALNYAMSGLDVWSYHVTNFFIHFFSGLALYVLWYRLILISPLLIRFRSRACEIAGLAALLWAIHPIQTESVTYIVQRAESLMGLFYFVTLYGFLEWQRDLSSKKWAAISVGSCLLGMLTKEVMVTAPWAVLFLDRIFIEKDFKALWQKKKIYYWALALTWMAAAYLIVKSGRRGDAIGYGGDISVIAYLKTQIWGMAHYLKLFIYPDGLTLDYGPLLITSWESLIAPSLLLLGVFLSVVIYRKTFPAEAFLVVWFFWALAPTSSFLPIFTQTIVEHRLYVSLAPLVFLGVILLYRLWDKQVFTVLLLVVIAWGIRTYFRNQDYQSEASIWAKNLETAPFNPRSYENWAVILQKQGKTDEAESYLKKSIEINPFYMPVYANLGTFYLGQQRDQEAGEIYRQAVKINPHFIGSQIDLANFLFFQKQVDASIKMYEEILLREPRKEVLYLNLGGMYEVQKQWDKAEQIYLQGLLIRPASVKLQERMSKLQQKRMEW